MACRPRDALQVLGQCVDLLGMLYVARKEDDAANAVVLNEVGDFLGGPGSLESGYEQLTDLLLQAHSNGIAGHNLTFLVHYVSHTMPWLVALCIIFLHPERPALCVGIDRARRVALWPLPAPYRSVRRRWPF